MVLALTAPSSSAQSTQSAPVAGPAAPAPTAQSPGVTPSRPAYDPDSAKPAAAQPAPMPPGSSVPAMPIPEPAPAPVVLKHDSPTARPKYTPEELFTAYEPYGPYGPKAPKPNHDSSAYIPVDSWIYPEMLRLYSLGYVDTAFLSLRPWTRLSVLHMLQQSRDSILGGDSEEAQAILAVLLRELEGEEPAEARGLLYGTQSAYTRLMYIHGDTLRDSYHLGQTLANDYGRPYEPGFNALLGVSTLAEYGRFSLHVRGEYQHAPSAAGYSTALGNALAFQDATPFGIQDTIPYGPIAAANPFRLVEGTLSFHLLGHEISGGKSDAWLGPGMGGAMAWSNNAENIYSFRINRIEPMYIPLVSKVLGPLRYDFFYGSLKGHTAPNHPWVHSDMFSFAPTANFQFGFQRTIIFGGAGHEPVTLHTFFKGFFDVSDTTPQEKFSRDDPGARYTAFNFSYRLPFVRNYLTLYTDSETHDDVFPVSAPRRAAYRSGIYLAQFPGMRRLDLRVEGVSTDCSTLICLEGGGQYDEAVQKQGYTNKGFIFGDWIGREAKGGQAWMTYHLSGNEWVQIAFLNKKTAKDFIAGGTTQNQFKVDLVKRLGKDVEVNGWVQYERWKAPIYLSGQRSDTTAAVQFTWFPKLHGGAGK